MFHALLRGILGSVLAGLLVASPFHGEPRKLQFLARHDRRQCRSSGRRRESFQSRRTRTVPSSWSTRGHYRDLFARKLEGGEKGGETTLLAMIYNNRLISYVKTALWTRWNRALHVRGRLLGGRRGRTFRISRDGRRLGRYPCPSAKEGFPISYSKKMLGQRDYPADDLGPELVQPPKR